MGKIYIVGLGNPGKQYENSRHNAGFMFVDALAKMWNVQWKRDASLQAEIAVVPEKQCVLVKPQTFMNESGKTVAELVKYGGGYDWLYVAYDDLDLMIGEWKIQWDKSPKIHNGVNSIKETLPNTSFWHIRLGTDGRNGDRTIPSESYVLLPFLDEEREHIEATIRAVMKEIDAKIASS